MSIPTPARSLIWALGMVLCTACGSDDNAGDGIDGSKSYAISLTLETQVHQLQGFDDAGNPEYQWVASQSPNYSFGANANDTIPVSFPGTVTVAAVDGATLGITFNENGSTCGINGLSANCAVGSSAATGYQNNNCGRTRMRVSVTAQ